MNSDSQAVNILKGLVIDGVSKAKSGHPGGAMSSMDFAYLLFTEYLKLDPKDLIGSEETDSYSRWTRVHAFIFYPPSGWLVRNE